jgi:hypothetical protein
LGYHCTTILGIDVFNWTHCFVGFKKIPILT